MKPIFLIGYMGSGKSTLGKILARQLDCDFIDIDKYIEARYRKTIRDLFAIYGESGFRKIERRLLEEVSDIGDVVIACGGGTPCFSDNMQIINSKGTSIYLRVPVERLYARLSRPHSKAKRPVIAGKTDEELMQFIVENLAARDKYYSQASFSFDTTNIETAAETEETAAILIDELHKKGIIDDK